MSEEHRKRVDELAKWLRVKPAKYASVGAGAGFLVNGYGNTYPLNELLIAFMLHMVKKFP